VVNLQIYSRTRERGEWANEQPFPFNSDQHSVGPPCISAHCNTIYLHGTQTVWGRGEGRMGKGEGGE